MKIFVCAASKVSRLTSQVGATHILSLIDPGEKKPFMHPNFDKRNWRVFRFEDNLEEKDLHSPTREHVSLILKWGRALPLDAIAIIHCTAGVSRSTAATLAVLVQFHGKDKIPECIEMLREVRPNAMPNPLITQFADDELDCGGKLFEAGEAMIPPSMRMDTKFQNSDV